MYTPKYTIYNPLSGYWLLDAGEPYSRIKFDLSQLQSYPLKPEYIDDYDFMLICDDLREWHLHKSDFEAEDKELRMLWIRDKFIKFFRNKFAFRISLNSPLPLPRVKTEVSCYNFPYRKECVSKMFYLDVAQAVVHGYETVRSVVEKYGVSGTNVRIWVSIYLTYGPGAFYVSEPYYDKGSCKTIMKTHIENRHTIHYTCASHLIFTYSAFKALRRCYTDSLHSAS